MPFLQGLFSKSKSKSKFLKILKKIFEIHEKIMYLTVFFGKTNY